MPVVQLKRSAVAGKIPLTTDLALGEIAINTFDGKLFLKRNNGSDSIREIGAVTVEKNGTVVGTRRNINFIEGTNITLTIADDSANDEVDITITAAGGGGGNLDSLTDVVITTPSTGQVLKYNGTNWINDADATSGGNLDSLTDVTIATLTAGQILRYNGTVWQNAEEVNTISELADVDFSSSGPPVNGDVLIYDGSSWFPNPDITAGVQDYLSNVATPLSRQTGTTLVPISVGTTAPTSPAIGDLWVDTN